MNTRKRLHSRHGVLCMMCLLWALTLGVGCRDQQAAEEEPPLTAADTQGTSTEADASMGADAATATGEDVSTTPPEDVVATDTQAPTDTQTPTDAPDVVTDPCEGPGRVEPVAVHGSGGALVTLRGAEFYIGALWWCMGLEGEDGRLHVVGGEVYAPEAPMEMCGISFLVPPLPPGDYKVSASYGCAFGEGDPREGAFGTLTISAPQAPLTQAVRCGEASPCALSYERCHPDLSICVGDICQFGGCYSEPRQPPLQDMCALVTGCVPPARQCVTVDDCRIAEVGCGCIGVHRDDPRVYGSECFLGGCVDCDPPPCGSRYAVTCDDGLCGVNPIEP